jgi:hypothetical protein
MIKMGSEILIKITCETFPTNSCHYMIYKKIERIRRCASIILSLFYIYMDTNETIYVFVFTDDARVGFSLHVHAADQAK